MGLIHSLSSWQESKSLPAAFRGSCSVLSLLLSPLSPAAFEGAEAGKQLWGSNRDGPGPFSAVALPGISSTACITDEMTELLHCQTKGRMQ